MNESIIYHLLDLESMIKLITKRGNPIAPGLASFPFPSLNWRKSQQLE
jgi:hypothetical protein